jgi:hypothetical protein
VACTSATLRTLNILWRGKTRRLRSTIERVFGDLPLHERRFLQDITRSGFAVNDVAAVVLGLNLWRDEIQKWRDRFAAERERPSMWRFAFGPSAAWDTMRWRALPLEARVLRARVGSLAHEVHSEGLARATLPAVRTKKSLRVLVANGFAEGADASLHFRPVASPHELVVDLTLVVIVTHWLGMCAVADRVSDDSSTSQVEVHGYPGACSYCRKRWLVGAKERWSIPPFHPACRCFAQPCYR